VFVNDLRGVSAAKRRFPKSLDFRTVGSASDRATTGTRRLSGEAGRWSFRELGLVRHARITVEPF
jgi:hypothetical protein